jgi:hypothetical protein
MRKFVTFTVRFLGRGYRVTKPPIPHKEISDKLINMKFEGSKFTLDPSCNIVCYLIAIGQLSMFY